MKNDFRDYRNEDYLMHGGEWANNLRRYVDKVRTLSGKWKYIYPEDLQKKASNLKRDISYGVRNAVSTVTGKNNTFNSANPKIAREKAKMKALKEKARIANDPYYQQTAKGQAGHTAWQNKYKGYRLDTRTGTRNLGVMSTHKNKPTDYSRVMNEQERIRKLNEEERRREASKKQKTQIYSDYAKKQRQKIAKNKIRQQQLNAGKNLLNSEEKERLIDRRNFEAKEMTRWSNPKKYYKKMHPEYVRGTSLSRSIDYDRYKYPSEYAEKKRRQVRAKRLALKETRLGR